MSIFFRIILFLEYIGLILIGIAQCTLDCNELTTPLGFVCVCNASYCDTVPKLEAINGSFYHIYSGKYYAGFNKRIITSAQELPVENAIKFSIKFHEKKQALLGFGGSFTDSFGLNVLSLTRPTQDNLLRSYFSAEGIKYSICRVPMGASDFSSRFYSYDDFQDDVLLNNFHLQPEDYNYKIDLIKRMKKISGTEVKLLTSNWSPPTWMKKSNTTESAYIKKEYQQLYADYQARFLEEYRKEGVHFWGITPVNEPMTGVAIHVSLNNVIMFPEEQRNWIAKHLGPTLAKNGFSGIKIIVLDDQRKYINWWMDTVMEDPEAANYTSGIGLHWYFDHTTSPQMLDLFHQKYPDKIILYTESSINKNYGEDLFRSMGIWKWGALYAQNIIEGLNHWNNGWIDWNMALDPTGGPNVYGLNCDSPIIVNKTTDEFYKQPLFYVLGHFSVFSRPGSAVVSVSAEKSPLLSHRRNRRRVPHFPSPFDPVPPKIKEDVYITATINPDRTKAIFILNGYTTSKNISLEIFSSLEQPPFMLNLTVPGDSLNTLVFS